MQNWNFLNFGGSVTATCHYSRRWRSKWASRFSIVEMDNIGNHLLLTKDLFWNLAYVKLVMFIQFRVEDNKYFVDLACSRLPACQHNFCGGSPGVDQSDPPRGEKGDVRSGPVQRSAFGFRPRNPLGGTTTSTPLCQQSRNG
jgi:hypothetical protein